MGKETISDELAAGDFCIRLDERNVTIHGRDVRLTPKEYDLMVYLLRHPGKVLTHHALLGAVWGGDYTLQMEYLRVFIGQLRKKIEVDPANPVHLTSHGCYRFDPGD